jgi:hypothetical protein
MALGVNISLCDMGAVLSHERRVAVPFYRDDRKVGFLQFEPAGPVLRELPVDSFDRSYRKRHEEPVLSVVLKLVGAVRTCYMPGSRVMPTLMEIFNMAITEGSGDLDSLSQAELTKRYNELAEAAKKPTVKGFKDKSTAISRIRALQGEVAEPTAAQKKAQAERDDKESHANDNAFNKHLAAKRAAKANGKKTLDDVKPAAKTNGESTPPAAKKTVAQKKPGAAKKAKAADAEKKPRGRGIGAFACDLILKGKTNEEVLEAVKKQFPDASTSASSVAWYRNHLKNEGKLK